MANANSTIEIELEIKQALDRLNRLERELQKSAQQMQKAADATGKLEGALNKAKTAAAGLFAFFSGQQIVEAADQFTNFANAVRISTSSVAEQTAVQKELYRVAQTTGSSIGDISKLYGRLRQAADQLGSSQSETIKITEIVGKALAASGTSASEASGALLQLAQALNSPRVQAEEFNSLVDAMPNLLRQVERQLGITAGGLKKFVTDGQLSNKLFRDAILGSASAIDDQFGKANDTIATALTRLNNAFILLVGNFEESTGFFNKTAAVISGLAENMDELVRVLKAVAVGFAIAFAPKVIRAIRDTATAMATLGAASKTNVIGALAALGFYIADITGGLDLLTEKLGLTKEETEKTADAIADLTKVSGGGVAAIAPVVPVPSQSYLQALDFMRSVISDTSMTSEQIMASLKDYSEAASAAIFDVQTKVVSGFDDIDGATIKTGQGIEEIRHIIQLFGLAYEQALGREAGESANVLALQFLAAQQAMKVLLDLRDQELAVIAEVEARIAAINERGIERTESERIILRYQNEIAEVMADETFSLLQRERIVKALESARDRELENAKEVLTYQEMITDELQTQLGLSEGAASAAVSGYFGAGPSASRAGNILQSTSLEEAAYKLVFSNEKVASAINEQFEMLFDLIDPLLEIFADIQKSINVMTRALLDFINKTADAVSEIPVIGDIAGILLPTSGPEEKPLSAAEIRRLSAIESAKALTGDIQSAIDGIVTAAEDSSLVQALNGFSDAVENIFPGLVEGTSLSLPKYGKDTFAGMTEYIQSQFEGGDYLAFLEDYSAAMEANIDYLRESGIEGELPIREAYLFAANALVILEKTTIDFVKNTTESLKTAAQDQIDSINFQTLSIEEQIAFRKDEALATLDLQRENAELIKTEEKRAELLAEITAAEEKQLELYQLQIQQFTEASNALTDAAISDIERRGLVFTEQQEIEYRYAKEIAAAQENTNLTIADQIRLVNALEAARQREIDALERSSYLLDLQSAQSGLAEILRNFEDAIEGIREIVQGLFDQVTELLFSEFNLMPVMEQFELAASRYSGLLEAAFDPDATEEDITNLQAFVNEYLSAARDVYKSSSTFQNIFKNVLSDLSLLGLQYSLSAPLGAVGVTRSDIQDLAEETGVSMDSLIQELDRLAIAFANQQLEFIGNVLQVDLGYVDVTASIPRLLDLGYIDVTASSTSTINLGNITPTFDSSPFTSAITTLNQSIANAINSLISTLQSASSAVSSGGTTTPVTPQTSIIYSLASGASSIAQYNMASMGPADRSSGVMSIGNTTSTGKNYTDAQYAKAFQGSYESLYGTIPADFGYVVILNAKTANSKYFIAHSSLQSAQSYYNSMLSNSYWSPSKYGFRQGGLVPDPMDTIPAMLSPGEYILSPETVRRFGVSSLNQLNSGDSSALAQTNDPDVKRLLAELIQAVRESDTEVNVYTDMRGQAKAAVEEFRSELKERTRRQNETYLPVRYI